MMKLMMRIAFALLLLVPCALAARPLEIYFIDVEGGQAALLISPSHQSLLIDAGSRGFNGRDAGRIAAAAKKAGIKQINYLLITNYEKDHVGGALRLGDRIKIDNFLDHGPLAGNSKAAREDFADYEKIAAAGNREILKPGSTIPIKGLDITVLTSAGAHISAPVHGSPSEGPGRPSPACAQATAQPPPEATTESEASIGLMVSYGAFHFLDLSDLPAKQQIALVCPANLIGQADVYLTPADAAGSATSGLEASGVAALVHAVRPRVAIVNNGPRKGGDPAAWKTLKDSPGLQNIWQLHYALAGGDGGNARDSFIANIDEFGQGDFLKLTARDDGSFSIYNSRNKFERNYPARSPRE